MTLMTVAALGGSVGSLLGMYTVRHKTKHPKFTIGIPLLLAGRIDATLNAEVVFADYHTELQLKSLKKIMLIDLTQHATRCSDSSGQAQEYLIARHAAVETETVLVQICLELGAPSVICSLKECFQITDCLVYPMQIICFVCNSMYHQVSSDYSVRPAQALISAISSADAPMAVPTVTSPLVMAAFASSITFCTSAGTTSL